jgi:hypothetical protein
LFWLEQVEGSTAIRLYQSIGIPEPLRASGPKDTQSNFLVVEIATNVRNRVAKS